MSFADWPITNPFFFESSLFVGYVPQSQLLVFYWFVTHIYKNLSTKKLRFHNQMNSTVKSNIQALVLNNNYPCMKYSKAGFLVNTKTIQNLFSSKLWCIIRQYCWVGSSQLTSFFSYPQNRPTLRCPISPGLQHASKIYLLLDFIMEGEIIATVSDCKLIYIYSRESQSNS